MCTFTNEWMPHNTWNCSNKMFWSKQTCIIYHVRLNHGKLHKKRRPCLLFSINNPPPTPTHLWLVFSRWFNCSNDTISMVFMFSGRGRVCARVMKPHNFLFSCRSDPGPRSVRNFSRTVPQSSRGLHPEHKCSVKKILFKSFIYPTKNHFKLFFLQINYKWMK